MQFRFCFKALTMDRRTFKTLFIVVQASACVSAMAGTFLHAPLKAAQMAIKRDSEDVQAPYEWSMPSVIQSGLVTKGAAITFNDTFASYRGRSFDLRSAQLKVGVTDTLQLFGGLESILAKGRSTTSRFYDNNNFWGFRYVAVKPTATNPSALSLQYESIRPGTAEINTNSGNADFDGTTDNLFAVNYGDRAKNQFQLSYASITAPGNLDAHVYGLGWGRDFQLNDWFLARLQGHLIAQSFNGAATHSSYEMKSILFGGLAANPTPWLSIEGDLTVLPSGMPFSGGEFTGVSGFAIYEPGGIVDNLRHDFIAFGSIRLTAHWRF